MLKAAVAADNDPASDHRTSVLAARNICKSFSGNQILKDVSLDVAKGEVVSVIGPSGSGKSSFLRSVNFLTPADSGEIYFNGKKVVAKPLIGDIEAVSVAALRRSVGMVFQSFELFPHLTILENVTLGPVRVAKKSKEEAKERAMSLLAQVGIDHKAHEYPGRCSGGQQQRAAIARALALDPQLILFDEPTSALDPEYGAEVLKVMRKLADDGMTMIVVTHEMAFAREVSDKIVVMADGEIIESGEPEALFASQSNARTQRFLAAVMKR
jgi:polar amino acid transport system ATP-binding protein